MTATIAVAGPPPLVDTHLHFNWDQAGETSVGEAIAILDRNHVVQGVVSSTPPEMALELSEAAPGRLIAFFMPYLNPSFRREWFRHPEVVTAAREALASGRFRGLGELHLVAGFSPSPAKPHPVVDGLMALAAEFDVPFIIHTEASSHRYFEPLCRRHPQVRIQWAHAGGILPPQDVTALLEACPNVWAEFAARDNDRYIENPIVDEAGRLLPAWRALMERFPERILSGSDPVWPVDGLNNWDQPNTGWQQMDRWYAFHRRWLKDLDPALSRRIRIENPRALYRLPGTAETDRIGP
ncbi:MAG: amidohydrolase [Gammaproteobacteria bacterium]|nr:amidohydrolase [Gammaproteobacteria bacterium]